MIRLLVALLLASSPAFGGFQLAPNAPSFPYFDHGPLFNVGAGDEQADTNAIAHVWFGVACPLAGHYVGGRLGNARKGMIVAAVSCTALIIIRETFFHRDTQGPEGRTDIATGLGSIWIAVGLMSF